MDSNDIYPHYIPINERVAILETKFENLEATLLAIEHKLDDLLVLKNKGMGALGLVSILIGSGVLGLVYLIFEIFKPHG